MEKVFIETDEFRRRWLDLGMNEEELRELQNHLLTRTSRTIEKLIAYKKANYRRIRMLRSGYRLRSCESLQTGSE
jgi:hypothetical protein